MGTYGRFSFACEAVSCFLSQTALADATLLIYNQHPIPLHFSHPRVRVVNVENPPGTTLRDIRAQMLAMANPDADLIHFWDDDDLYLPWHLQDCLDNIGESVAWKPHSSWTLHQPNTYHLGANTFESSWAFRADYIKAVPIDTHPTSPELPVYIQTKNDGLLSTTELLGRSSFIYRWHAGQVNHSSLDAQGTTEKQRQVLKFMRSKSNDVNASGQLVAADLSAHWRHFLLATQHLVTPDEWIQNKVSLGLPDLKGTSEGFFQRAWARFNPLSK